MRTGRDARRERGRGPARTLAALGCLLLVGAIAAYVALGRAGAPTHRTPTYDGSSAVHASRPLPAAAHAGHDLPAGRLHAPMKNAGRPVRVTIPSLGVSAPVTPVELDGSALVPPSDPRTVGWWRDGGVPGARRGTAVIAGHTVHTGGGAFDDLGRLRRGDRVRVDTGTGPLRYVVMGTRIYSKASLAAHAGSVFSQSVPGRLVLVTCDDWNGTDYESNAVVRARPVRGR